MSNHALLQKTIVATVIQEASSLQRTSRLSEAINGILKMSNEHPMSDWSNQYYPSIIGNEMHAISQEEVPESASPSALPAKNMSTCTTILSGIMASRREHRYLLPVHRHR